MSEGDQRPDMVNRDPNNLNDNLLVTFEDVFGEPDGAHSPDCAWKCGFMCYEKSRSCCYKCLTVLCTWLMGLCWGCGFAMLTFQHVWCLTPQFKFCSICLGFWQKFYEVFLNCCLGPMCSTSGLYFSNIKVTQG